MRKTTIVVLDQHQAAYEAFRRERPQLTLTQFYAECATFRLQHGDEASLKPAIKAQHALIQRLDATLKILANPPPLVDHARLEHHSKSLAEHVTAAVQHLEHGVQTAAVHAIDGYRRTFWQVALGAFALGAVVGAGCLSLSWILW
jgi:hypothetical protein